MQDSPLISQSPYDVRLIKPNLQNGPEHYSDLLIIGDVPGNEVKVLGAKTFAADQSAGKLAPIHPMYAGTHLANYGHGGALHDDVNYRNAHRRIQHDLTMHNIHPRLDQRFHTRTPMPTPPYIPVDYFLSK